MSIMNHVVFAKKVGKWVPIRLGELKAEVSSTPRRLHRGILPLMTGRADVYNGKARLRMWFQLKPRSLEI